MGGGRHEKRGTDHGATTQEVRQNVREGCEFAVASANDGLDEDVAWRHGMTQALNLPLHDVIAKSRVINSGWSFMLIICESCG